MSDDGKIMKDKPVLMIDIRKTIDNLNESIEKNTEVQNRIWHGVLRLVITLSSSLLLVTIALVEKIFNSTIPEFLFFSWILFFVSIVIGIVAEINEVIEFSNGSIDMSKQINDYEKQLSSGAEVPYCPEDNPYLIKQNNIWWGTGAILLFTLAVLFMCVALLERRISCSWCWFIIIVNIIFIGAVTFHLIKKRKTGIAKESEN